jgi:hypothetical protein
MARTRSQELSTNRKGIELGSMIDENRRLHLKPVPSQLSDIEIYRLASEANVSDV